MPEIEKLKKEITVTETRKMAMVPQLEITVQSPYC